MSVAILNVCSCNVLTPNKVSGLMRCKMAPRKNDRLDVYNGKSYFVDLFGIIYDRHGHKETMSCDIYRYIVQKTF